MTMRWNQCSKPKKIVPDQGWCWVMFIATCVLMFMVFGVHYTYGILYPSLLKEFKKGEGKTAWVGSLSSGLLFFSSIFAIKLCDVTSVATTLLIGAIVSGCGLILTSIVTNFETLYFVYGILFGVGSSLLYTPCLIMIGRWFRKYQAIATGAAVASSALGAVVLSPMIQHIIQINGFRRAIKSCGIGYISIAMICAFCFKPFSNNKPAATTNTQTGSEENLKTIQDSTNAEDPEILIEISKELEDSSRHDFTVNCNLFRNKEYVMFLVVMMITNFTYYMPIIHLVNYATHLGISASSASLLISIWSASVIIGRLFYGKLMTYIRPRLLIIYQASMFCSGIVSLLAFFAKSYWSLTCYVVLYGFLDGSFLGLLSLVTMDIVGLKDFAQGFGIMLTLIGVPIAVGPPIIGMINDSQCLPPQFMFILAGSLFIIGSVLMNFIRIWRKTKLEEDKHKKRENESEKKRCSISGGDDEVEILLSDKNNRC